MAAVVVLEDDEGFNAGRGAVLTAAGSVELDAAVADGRAARAGAVAAVSAVRNPVLAAKMVMERTPHVLVVGGGADALARQEGLDIESAEWFVTSRRRDELTTFLQSGSEPTAALGTVGAVALDADGHLAAATSSGGTTGQLPGRVGDTPLLGAGTWADDRTCAVSATGLGEAFVLSAFAHEVDALLRLHGLDLDAACRQALELIVARGGTGGCIAVGRDATLAMPFTSRSMFRGWADGTAIGAIDVAE